MRPVLIALLAPAVAGAAPLPFPGLRVGRRRAGGRRNRVRRRQLVRAGRVLGAARVKHARSMWSLVLEWARLTRLAPVLVIGSAGSQKGVPSQNCRERTFATAHS